MSIVGGLQVQPWAQDCSSTPSLNLTVVVWREHSGTSGDITGCGGSTISPALGLFGVALAPLKCLLILTSNLGLIWRW